MNQKLANHQDSHLANIHKLESSILKQLGFNKETLGNFNNMQKRLVQTVMEVEKKKTEIEENLERTTYQNKAYTNKKVFMFSDHLLQELKHMIKVTESKILFQIGFYDRNERVQPHKPEDVLNDLVSSMSEPSFAEVEALRNTKRPNSVHQFEPPKVRQPRPKPAIRKR